MRKFDEEYTSKLAKNSLIYLAVNFVVPSLILTIIMGIFAATDTAITQTVGVLIALVSTFLPLILFVALYVCIRADRCVWAYSRLDRRLHCCDRHCFADRIYCQPHSRRRLRKTSAQDMTMRFLIPGGNL